MAASRQSLRGLDLANVFMADVKDGVGVYLSVYLLTEHHWNPSEIGVVVAIPAIVSIVMHSPVGGFIDKTRRKRFLLVVASAMVALSCLAVIFFPQLVPIAASQVVVGLAQTTFPPCIAAITLGMVGHQRMTVRIGRNESFNHAGNMLAAVISLFLAWLISYRGIFYFSVFQCVAIIFATSLIRERDIDHELARAAAEHDRPPGSMLTAIKTLLSNKQITFFIAAICLWNVANGTMLPLLGQKLGIADSKNSALWLSICIIIAQSVMVAIAPLAAKLALHGRKPLLLIAFVLVPVRAVLFALVSNKYVLIALQLIDGLGAGFYGVMLIVMMADLGKGTGHFSLLQGATYTALSVGLALSSILGGAVAKHAGYDAAFLTLAAIGTLGTVFLVLFVKETRSGPELDTLSESAG